MARALGIHVIGAGFGESIVVEMPNGRVGVIDCFAGRLQAKTRQDRLDANPTLRFLVNDLKADSLAFVGFTHPHEDHGRGLSHLLTEFAGKIERIWVFQACGFSALERHFRALREGKLRLPIEKILEESPGAFYLELLRIQELIDDQILGKDADRFAFFRAAQPFKIDGEPVSVTFLGPADVVTREYQKDLEDNMKGLVVEQGKSGQGKLTVSPDWKPEEINHNKISSALLLKYGSTRILLGGDMEGDAWEHVLKAAATPALGNKRSPLACELVKVGHHGSPTGYTDSLYPKHLAARRKPLAILTPFNRHQRPLPSRTGLAQVHPWVSELLTTNRREALLALGSGKDAAAASPSTVPAAWLLVLNRDKALWNALDPAVRPPGNTNDPPTAVPADLLPLLRADPGALKLLHPVLRRTWVRHESQSGGAAETVCRVSVYFNHQGKELRRFIGADAGKLSRASTGAGRRR
jgi:beta-lactamase superfamily II metal-dependent hydrolase